MTCHTGSILHLMYYLLLTCLNTLIPVICQAPIAKQGCKDSCGGISIRYPFGIGLDCSGNPWFEIACKTNPPQPFLTKLNIQVMNINYDVNSATLTVGIPPFNMCTSGTQKKLTSIDLRGTPFNFSRQSNVFVMQGCAGSSVLRKPGKEFVAGCSTVCPLDDQKDFSGGCYGVGCCLSSLTSGIHQKEQDPEFVELTPQERYLEYYEVEFNNRTSSGEDSQGCLVSTLVDSSSKYTTRFAGETLISNISSTAPAVLSWEFQPSRDDAMSNPNCYFDTSSDIVDCQCQMGYEGNPYLPDGCEVIEECKKCKGRSCYGPYGGGGGPDSYVCETKPIITLGTILGLSIGAGTPLLVISCYLLYRLFKWRKEKKQRKRFFKLNGGLLLQQQLFSTESAVEKTKIFTTSELDKATDHFNKNRVLGEGGQGTVYKGMLTDGRIVAVKKSKKVDESQLGQFINEVVILSQINHRNVVKLLGCCLETEVPLLVYEFIPNGTLAHHIHVHPSEEDYDHLPWEMRLRIAAESAGAIAYLHSSSSPPIYHRDIKSSNILLDEKNRAKVSDFGSSKTIAIDQTHLTTLVQGTMGYLDPEYFQSYQFTEKSDVYSFGVVLLELLTSQRPIYRGESMEQKNLVTEFFYVIDNGGSLFEFIDPRVAKEAEEEALLVVVNLARRCLSWSSKLRPTMKEVTMILEMIIQSPSHLPMLNSDVASLVNGGKERVIAEIVDCQLERSGCTVQSSSGDSSCGFSSVDEPPLLLSTM